MSGFVESYLTKIPLIDYCKSSLNMGEVIKMDKELVRNQKHVIHRNW